MPEIHEGRGVPLDNSLGVNMCRYFVALVQVINFSTTKRCNIHGKAWILPRLSVCFPWKQFRRNRDDP